MIKLNKLEIVEVLNNKYEVEIFESIDSTNLYLKRLGLNNIVVASDEQTLGQGRNGRIFESKVNSGLYFSFSNNKLEIVDLNYITIIVAIAVTRVLRTLYDIKIDLKWLNDLYFDKKKLGGILTQVSLNNQNNGIEQLIIGIGINIENNELDYAIALDKISDASINRNLLISNIINEYEKIYQEYKNQGINLIINEYKSYMFILNQQVEVSYNLKTFEATVLDINLEGQLVVQTENEILHLNSGEVSLKLT